MTYGLIPPTLDDVGHILWGANWREYLANFLEVTGDDIANWETEPSTRPGDLADALQRLGNIPIGEISIIVQLVKTVGLAGPPA